jgi:hypothetical protein
MPWPSCPVLGPFGPPVTFTVLNFASSFPFIDGLREACYQTGAGKLRQALPLLLSESPWNERSADEINRAVMGRSSVFPLSDKEEGLRQQHFLKAEGSREFGPLLPEQGGRLFAIPASRTSASSNRRRDTIAGFLWLVTLDGEDWSANCHRPDVSRLRRKLRYDDA